MSWEAAAELSVGGGRSSDHLPHPQLSLSILTALSALVLVGAFSLVLL